MRLLAEYREETSIRKPASAWTYIVLAFGFAWTVWIVSIKFHAPEEVLNIGTAGPAIAMLVLTRRLSPRVHRATPKRAVQFLLVLALCWTILTLYYGLRNTAAFSLQPNLWALIPSILSAWVISSLISPDAGVRGLASSLVHFKRWSLIALSILPGILVMGEIVARWLHQPLAMPQSHRSAANVVASAVLLFSYNVLFVAVLEEPGWRGYLLPRLQERWPPLTATLLVWLPWALWHAPLDYFRPIRFSLLMYLEIRVIFLIPIAIILTWLYNKSGHSVQACVAFHASINTFPFVLPYWMPSFALLFVVAGIALVSDRMWCARRY